MATRQSDRTALVSASACSVEIFVHTLLLLLILLPLTTLVFPFLAFHVGVSLLNSNLSADWHQWKNGSAPQELAVLSDGQEIALAIGFTVSTLATSVLGYRRHVRQPEPGSSDTRRYLSPKGERGRALIARIEAFWSEIALQSATPPEVLWFPGAAVLARAMTRSNRFAVAVSTGLWEIVNRDDLVAKVVVLHELAHLSYGDPLTFVRLKALLDMGTRTLARMFRVLIFTILFLIAHQFIANHRGHMGAAPIIRQTLMIGGIGLLALSICPVSAAMIKRYIGLITSLIELRADVRSAQWAGGLERFAEILANNPMVHRSTFSDRTRSWFSLGLTHLSESERLQIVRHPERLLTPKVQYFFFSLILVLLLPVNGLTPLFEGGIVDLAAVVTVASALTITVSTMLLLAGATSIRISLSRLFALSMCSVLFTAACQINFYTLTYSLSTVAVEIGLPGRGATLSWNDVSADTIPAFHDIGHQLLMIWSGGWIICGVLITMVAFGALLAAARRLRHINRSSSWPLIVIAAATGVGVLLDGYDPWRTFTLENTVLGRAFVGWAAVTAHFPGIRFTLGPWLALASVVVLVAIDLGLGVCRSANLKELS
jgi:hypothetical protein